MDIITLIKALVSGLVDAEEDFLKHLDTFSMFEESVRILTVERHTLVATNDTL